MADWRFLAGNEQLESTEFDGTFRGLALPREVIDKIYSGNARRRFPQGWDGSGNEQSVHVDRVRSHPQGMTR
jgi:hypothetical protein